MHHCTSTDLISYPVISVSLNILTSNQLMCVYNAVRPKFLNIHLSWSVPCLNWWYCSFQNLLLKVNLQIPCCSNAVPLPCPFGNSLYCVCPVLIYTVRPCLIQYDVTRLFHATTMQLWKRNERARHGAACASHGHDTRGLALFTQGQHVVVLQAFGFFRLPRGLPWRLSSEALQSVKL
jgi:hypothetical protein